MVNDCNESLFIRLNLPIIKYFPDWQKYSFTRKNCVLSVPDSTSKKVL